MTLLSNATPLRDELVRALPERPFTVELWDGSEVSATNGGGPTFRVRSPKALGHMLRAPGQLGIGRAYVAGELEVDDLDAVLALLSDWSPPALDRAAQLRLALAAARAAGVAPPPRPPAAELRPRGRRHSIAQRAKLELSCGKLALEPGMRMLDIGCGWGSLAIHAAAEHGVQVVGITLSEPQAELARLRVAERGLSDQVEIRVMDYRELADAPFDAVASIGMVEHVGANQIDVYARQVARLLRPGGNALNHGIARLRHGDPEAGAFSERYVFPDAAPLHVSRVLTAFERAGLVTAHVEELEGDYAITLEHWARRLDEHREEALRLAGPERLRVWRLYLRAARNGFTSGFTSVYQVRCRKPHD